MGTVLLSQEKDAEKILYGLDDIEGASDIVIVCLTFYLPGVSGLLIWFGAQKFKLL